MLFSSHLLPPTERISAYETALRRYFSSFGTQIDVRVDEPGAETFEATLKEFSIGNLGGAFHCSNAPHLLHAKPRAGEEWGMDLYMVQGGQISFTDDDGSVVLTKGDIALLRTDGEFSAKSARMDMIALGIPTTLLGKRAVGGWWGRSRRFDGDSGLGACLGSLLSTAASHHQDMSIPEGAVIQNALIDTLTFLGATEADGRCVDLSALQREKLINVKAIALRSLQIQSLDVEAVAKEAGISVRTLHRLFSATGSTFAFWLRERRLERCWNELSDPSRPRNTIAAIAFGWGFSDLRTFNRTFIRKYGLTPQEARARASVKTLSRRRSFRP